MSDKKLGVAIQGAGWVSTEHIHAYQQNPHTRVVAIGSRTKEGAERKAAQTGLSVPVFDDYAELLAHPEVDVVSICTPSQRHAEETILAAKAGKHILIEKPVATELDDLYRMHEAVQKAGVRTVVSFVLHWNPAVQNIKAVQQQGLLGDTYMVQTDYWHNTLVAGLVGKKGRVTAMLEGGCHAMDAARHLMDSDIVDVTAVDWTPDGEAAANTVALVHFANGGIGKVSACTSQWMPYAFNIDVFGTAGAIRGNRLSTKHFPGLTAMAELPTVLPDSGDVSHHPFPGEMNHFVDCILEGKESPVNLADAVNTHEAVFAADMSVAEGGRTIKLPLR